MSARVERIGDATLYLGDCLAEVCDINYDSIVSDPPYGISFVSNHRKEMGGVEVCS